MFVKKKGKKILKLIQIHGEEQRYEVDAFKYKTQRRMGDGGSQKSEAKVEVGNGKSEVGSRKTLLRFEWEFISGFYLKDLKYKAKI